MIVVHAKRRNQVQVLQSGELGALGTMRAIDAPFSIRSYTASLILDQQSQTLGEVLENDPSVRTTEGYGNFSEVFVIRGFPLDSDDVSIDGLYGIAPRQLVAPELYDQVQVLNGANAFLNGAAPGGTSIGGGVNLVMKQASDTELTRFIGTYQSAGLGGGGVDLGRRLGIDDRWGARLTISGDDGDTSVHDEQHDQLAIGGAFDYRGDKLRVSLDLDFQHQAIYDGRPEVFVTGKVPNVPAASANDGQTWSFTRLRDVFGILHASYQLTDAIELYALGGAKDGTEAGNYSTITVTDPLTGDGTGSRLYVPTTTDNESLRGGVRIDLATGPVRHQLDVGSSALWETFRTAYAQGDTFPTNIYDTAQVPVTPTIMTSGDLANPRAITDAMLKSVYASDTAKFLDDRVELIAGFRWQDIDETEYAYAGGFASGYDQSAVTPVVGVVFHPTRDTALYFNRIEGLSEGAVAPAGSVNAGEIFPPYRSVQYEVGAKYITARLTATLAFYRIAEPNALQTIGAEGIPIYSENGDQTNQGIEYDLTAQPLRGVRLIGGVAFNHAILEKTSAGLYDGNAAIGIPTYTLNANAEWDTPFLLGGTLTGRVIRTGPQDVDEANTASIPGWTRFDLGGRYTFLAFRKPLTVRVGVDNVTDARFWASSFGGYLVQGLPRTYKLSLSVDL